MLSSTHTRSSFSDSSGYDDKGEERKLNELENDDVEEVPNYGTSKENTWSPLLRCCSQVMKFFYKSLFVM
jgi:hypothetical protein